MSLAASRCIALRPLCRSAATTAWSKRLLHSLNTDPELLLLLPPAAAPGSFLTVLPDAAAACVRALVETVNAAPPFQRAELLRVRGPPGPVASTLASHFAAPILNICCSLSGTLSLLRLGDCCVCFVHRSHSCRQPSNLASHTTAQAALDTLSARIFIPSSGHGSR
jgi:hypothetical protein